MDWDKRKTATRIGRRISRKLWDYQYLIAVASFSAEIGLLTLELGDFLVVVFFEVELLITDFLVMAI